jgi:hypothetical protein
MGDRQNRSNVVQATHSAGSDDPRGGPLDHAADELEIRTLQRAVPVRARHEERLHAGSRGQGKPRSEVERAVLLPAGDFHAVAEAVHRDDDALCAVALHRCCEELGVAQGPRPQDHSGHAAVQQLREDLLVAHAAAGLDAHAGRFRDGQDGPAGVRLAECPAEVDHVEALRARADPPLRRGHGSSP